MNQYNPYAAPAADQRVGFAPLPAGAPQPWTSSEAVSQAWGLFKIHWAPLVLGYFVMFLLQTAPGQLPTLLVRLGLLELNSTLYSVVSLPCTLVGWLIGTFFTCGFLRATLKVARGQAPSFGDFFSGTSFLSVLGATFLMSLAVAFGLVLLIVPGVILALGFFNAQFYAVDQRMGPIDALKASWDSTNGQKGDVFVFSLLSAVVMIGGALACCVGMFAAAPIVMIAHAIVYTRMSGTVAATQEPPGYGPPGGGFGPPGGGFGPPGYGPPGYGGPPPGGFGGPPPGGGYGPPGY